MTLYNVEFITLEGCGVAVTGSFTELDSPRKQADFRAAANGHTSFTFETNAVNFTAYAPEGYIFNNTKSKQMSSGVSLSGEKTEFIFMDQIMSSGLKCVKNPYYNITPPPQPPPQPPPLPPPPPIKELYEFRIIAANNPELPSFLVSKLRNLMYKGGYNLSNIHRVNNGYILQTEKTGSITLIAILVIIAAVLALLWIKIISVSMIRISDNKTQKAVSSDISNSITEINKFCKDNHLSQAECNEMILSLKEVYAVTTPPPVVNGGNGGLFGKIEPLLIGALMIGLIASMKK